MRVTPNRRRPLPWLTALTALAIASVFFLLPTNTQSASAHPLGNFSVNRLSLLEVTATGEVHVTYVVDLAEIPAFQARDLMDPNGDGVLSDAERQSYLGRTAPGLVANLVLEVDGSPVSLEVTGSDIELVQGQAGLNTARIAVDASGSFRDGWHRGAKATYEDRNFSGVNGWRQIIVKPAPGIELLTTSAPVEDVTDGLTKYPRDLLDSPPAVTKAAFDFRAGTAAPAPMARPEAAGDTVSPGEANKTLGRFAALVTREHLTPAVIAGALLLSAAWGAMHALGPGHGKTVVAAYLVGERGTGRHAIYLGLIVTVTHTVSVFALGAIALFASNVIATDAIYHWLSLGSGLLVALLGGALLAGRVRRLLQARDGPRDGHAHQGGHGHPQGGGHSHDHDEDHTHDHGHRHGHSHLPSRPGWRGIVALGVAGGIVPCPTALVVMLGSIALDRTAVGLVMVTAFSTGLAGVLVGIGLLMVYGRRWLETRNLPARAAAVLRRAQLVAPVLSAVTILGLGLLLTSRALL